MVPVLEDVLDLPCSVERYEVEVRCIIEDSGPFYLFRQTKSGQQVVTASDVLEDAILADAADSTYYKRHLVIADGVSTSVPGICESYSFIPLLLHFSAASLPFLSTQLYQRL